MRTMRLWSLFLLFIAGMGEMHASHIAGAEITYRNQSANIYKFTLKVYRDCRECKFNNIGGGESNSNCNEIPNLAVRGALGTAYASSQFGTVEITRSSIADITPVCHGSVSKCRTGSNISSGYEVHIFEGIYDFTSLINSGYCNFDISVSLASRSQSINSSMSEQNFFNYAMLNLCEGQPNHSSLFKSQPVFTYQLNQSNFVSPGIVNPDGDSVVYKLKPALINRSQSVSYPAGRSGDAPFSYFCGSGSPACVPNLNNNPVEGFYCSDATGDVVFTPVQNNQSGVLVLECQEWKKGSGGQYYLAGVTRRDIYGDVVSTGNYLPVITFSKDQFVVCSPDILNTELQIEDRQTVGQVSDTVHAFVVSGPQGVQLEKSPSQNAPWFKYRLILDPVQAGPGLHKITIGARDNSCPLNGISLRTVQVLVLSNRKYAITYSTGNCGMLDLQVAGLNKNLNWTVKDRNQNVLKQQNARRISVQLQQGGPVYIETLLPSEPGFCEVSRIDTVMVPDFSKPALDMGQDRKVCHGSLLELNPQEITVREPYILTVNGEIAQDGFPYIYKADKEAVLNFQIRQEDGCEAVSQIQITLFPSLEYSLSDDSVCINDVFPVTVKNVKFRNEDVDHIRYECLSPYSELNRVNDHIWTFALTEAQPHTAYLRSVITDKNSCAYEDSTFIAILEPEPIEVTCPSEICQNADPVQLQTMQGGSWECVNQPGLVRNNKLQPDGHSYGNLVLKYTQMLRCRNSKTFMVRTNDTTALEFKHPDVIELCENSGLFKLEASPAGGNWHGQFIEDGSFNPEKASGRQVRLMYTYINAKGCLSEAPVIISSQPLPGLEVLADKQAVCVGDLLWLQAVSSLASPGYWYTNGTGSFEEPAEVVTTYRPGVEDISKGELKFIYTIQTNGVCGNISAEVRAAVKQGPSGKILADYQHEQCEPASLKFNTDFTRLEKQYWFINDSLVEEFDYAFSLQALLPAGIYVIKTKVADSACEALAISDPITIWPRPKAAMISNPSNKISREYPRLYLKDATVCKDSTFINWYLNNVWINNNKEFYFKVEDNRDTFYIKLVTASKTGNCADSVEQMFVFAPRNQLFIPDAFSPDSKGPEENNTFRVRGPAMKMFILEIYNRFGEKVFMSVDMNEVWDGSYRQQICAPGVYFYKIVTTDFDGIDRDYSGTVTLIR